jgi:hypothetical protein
MILREAPLRAGILGSRLISDVVILSCIASKYEKIKGPDRPFRFAISNLRSASKYMMNRKSVRDQKVSSTCIRAADLIIDRLYQSSDSSSICAMRRVLRGKTRICCLLSTVYTVRRIVSSMDTLPTSNCSRPMNILLGLRSSTTFNSFQGRPPVGTATGTAWCQDSNRS